LIERKAEIKESKRWIVRAFQQRPSSWVSRALNEQLTPFGVDQIPYQELLINPDFDKVCKNYKRVDVMLISTFMEMKNFS
jgi:hypothetical protein